MSVGALWLTALASALLTVHLAQEARAKAAETPGFGRPILTVLTEGFGWIAALIVGIFAVTLSGLPAPALAAAGLWLGLSHLRRTGRLRPLSSLTPVFALIALAATLYLFQAVIGDRSVPALENLIPE